MGIRHGSLSIFQVVTLIAGLIIFLSLPCSADSFYPNAGVDTTDEAATVELNHRQWLLDYEWDFEPFGEYWETAYLGYKQGLTNRLDFGIELPYSMMLGFDSAASGFDDIGLGVKYLWTPLKEKHILCATVFSMQPASSISNSAFSDGTCDYSLHMVASYEHERWRHHLNLGETVWGAIPDIPRSPTTYYKFKADYQFSPQWSLSGEVYGETSPNVDFYPSPFQTTVKTSWQLNDHVTLDFGIAFGLNPDSPVRRYLFGLTIE